MVPFSQAKNIDLKELVLILAGGLAWLSVYLKRKQVLAKLSPFSVVLLASFIFGCLANGLFYHAATNLFDLPFTRLGLVGLLACAGCGLALMLISGRKIMRWFYASTVLMAVAALPFDLASGQIGGRPGGLFYQADILAVFMGIGLLLGIYLWRIYPARKVWLLIAQALMLTILLLTQTRAVIFILVFLALMIIYNLTQRRLLAFTVLAALVLMIYGLHVLVPTRLTDPGYVVESVSYRLSLQKSALSAVKQMRFFGYGGGNIMRALPCYNLQAPKLLVSCKQGYYFNSSHNVFIDRLLTLGWWGGLSYALFVSFSLFKGWQQGSKRILFYCALLIGAYYFTNITNIELELWFWVILLQISKFKSLTESEKC
ncbi:MAG TPA: O-antigen ligase family protein [Candidatus Saccharimonadales bacterium]|nr:O-antigen ligase family protein [Candidatus Saccharimonadales bacterium]